MNVRVSFVRSFVNCIFARTTTASAGSTNRPEICPLTVWAFAVANMADSRNGRQAIVRSHLINPLCWRELPIFATRYRMFGPQKNSAAVRCLVAKLQFPPRQVGSLTSASPLLPRLRRERQPHRRRSRNGPDAADRGRDHRAQQRQLRASRTGHRGNKKALDLPRWICIGMGNLRGHRTDVSELVATEVADVN